ncbi:hypothetical protein [Neisseria zalophi]|uniref:DUF4238 domain-containing protein n=1 Tax=Neisseria zalophi TaxID=640030 RepID=A0A5J6PZM6_9NEIS|nr:hypothetical protein [Neisseria zalophi]QEY26322.1 hypothetical protein D0T92_07110 [Neisseria zalophi]
MKQAFILSDCEPPVCEEKPYALLTANVTKGHHFIAQTEQRQHAFNTNVNPQNQNVYRFGLEMFRKPYRGQANSVNIENNLEVNNLYTLSFVEGSGGSQYNLENWFSRYESGYEDACNMLKTIRSGKQKVPQALWRVLQLKMLGIFRNPYNHNSLFANHLHKAIWRQLPHISTEFISLIAARPQPRLSRILQTFAFSPDGYTRWLANLYGMLSDGVMQPSVFERLFAAVFADSDSVKIELFRYGEESDCCFFADTGFCVQSSKEMSSVGLSISADMFAIVHIKNRYWSAIKNHFAEQVSKRAEMDVTVFDNNQQQRITYNRLCVREAREAVFGKSNHREDYF